MAEIKSGRRLITRIREYIDDCKAADTKKPVFANVAGFCRFAGISVADFLALKRRFPAEYELAGAYFEDAALNSGATATLVGMYLRQYGLWAEPVEDDIVCDHDMLADGV